VLSRKHRISKYKKASTIDSTIARKLQIKIQLNCHFGKIGKVIELLKLKTLMQIVTVAMRTVL
jgi:hypothetical protein